MPSAAQAIIDKAKGALNDPEAVHWPLPELVGYLNDAQSATVLARPEANPKVIQMKLEPGTRQKIPDGDGAAADIRPVGIKAYSLIDVVRNMGRNGATPGRAIRPCGRETLDQCNPSWHSDPASDTTINFIYDTRNRETFYVWPAATGAAWIEMVIAVSPKQIELAVGDDGSVSLPETELLSIDEVYDSTILAYVLYRAFLKEVAQEDAFVSKSQNYYQQFAQSLGISDEKEVELTIKRPILESMTAMGG